MQLDIKTLSAVAGGVVVLSAAISTVGSYMVFRPEFTRANNLLQMQITEDKVEQKEVDVCMSKAGNELTLFMQCMNEFERYAALRTFKEIQRTGN